MNALGQVTRSPVACGPAIPKGDPPSPQSLRQFAISHYRKLMCVGIAAIVAGLALMAADFFTGGLSLPFTLQLEITLVSTGIVSLGTGLLGVILAEQEGKLINEQEGGSSKVKPKGHRASSHVLLRGLALKHHNAALAQQQVTSKSAMPPDVNAVKPDPAR